MKPRVVSFAWNHQGLGHASRLTAVHSELRELGFDSQFLVEHPQPLIADYGFAQLTVPPYPDSLVGDSWWSSDEADPAGFRRGLAKQIVDYVMRPSDIVLHDVILYRPLYEWATAAELPQALISRARRDRPEPAAWVARHAPAVRQVYILGRPGDLTYEGKVAAVGVPDVIRKPLDEKTIWDTPGTGGGAVTIAISAAGGGHGDAQAFLAAALAGVHRFADLVGTAVSVFVVCGPYFKGAVPVPAGMPGEVRVAPYLPPTSSLYRDSDLVICHGGYNTAQELARTGARAVTVPGVRQLDDQRARLATLAATANILVSEPDASAIAEALTVLAKRTAAAYRPVSSSRGAQEIARLVAGLAAPDDQARSATET